MVLFLFNVIYTVLLLWLCILTVCLCMTTLTEVFLCFFLSCKANTRVKPAKTGHGPHSSYFFFLFFSVIFVFFYELFCVIPCIVCVCMCTVLLPPGGYPIAVKYIIYHNLYEINALVFDKTTSMLQLQVCYNYKFVTITTLVSQHLLFSHILANSS
jgi:hypothetical protein